MRALAWEFPNDPSLADIDNQFLVGPSIMVIPVLEPQVDTVKGVFPGVGNGEVWYDWYTHTAVDTQPGVNTTISAPLGHIPVFVRGGSVIPMQEPALTTRDARKTPWSLLTSLSEKATASGQLYIDDGESINPEHTLDVEFKVSHSKLQAKSTGTWKEANPLANVTILGVSKEPSSVTFNGKKVASESVAYNHKSKALAVSGLQELTKKGAWAKDWVLEW